MMTKEYTLEDVVIGLIGHIFPYGDTWEDERRLNNIKELHQLIEIFVEKLVEIEIGFSSRPEKSIKDIHEVNHEFLENLKEYLTDNLNEV